MSLLGKTRDNCLQEIGAKAIAKMEGVPFENLVFEQMCIAAKGTAFDGDVVQTGPQTFPDIIAKQFYGTEVKATTDNKWSSTGNSVTESTRVKGVERIYMFFGKFGGGVEIKFRPYQEVLFAIGVTHSPRYKIDMDLGAGNSIFDKMGVDYDTLRQEANPIKKIKEYYRSLLTEGEELWWIDPQTDATVNPVIRSFNKFSEEEKSKFMTECMILFPEMFGSGRMKFERAAAYLITGYNAVTANMRDTFSAGGQMELVIEGKKLMVPKIFYHLYQHAKAIAATIDQLDEELLLNYWRVAQIDGSRLDFWKSALNHNADTEDLKIAASTIFEAGLNEKAN